MSPCRKSARLLQTVLDFTEVTEKTPRRREADREWSEWLGMSLRGLTGEAGFPAGAVPHRGVLYPQTYLWYVFLSALDLLFTWTILYLGGRELNAVADWIIRNYQAAGIAAYKFGLVVLVVLVCEFVGRRRHALGRTLARWAVTITAVPVIIGATHLLDLAIYERVYLGPAH